MKELQICAVFLWIMMAGVQASQSSDSDDEGVGLLQSSRSSYLFESDSDDIGHGLRHSVAGKQTELEIPYKLRILNVCGGGTRGILSTTILSELEKKIGNGFDASQIEGFGGTSTGGLVAMAKAIGLPTQTLYDLYMNQANQIFYKSAIPYWQQIWQLFKEKYSDKNFLKVVKSLVGEEKTLGDVAKHLVMISYDIEGGEDKKPAPFVMYSKGDDEKKAMKLWECARSTTAAPTYFEPYYMKAQKRSLVDGAVCANDPSLMTLLEIANYYGDRPNVLRRSRMVTIGTGYYQPPVVPQASKDMGAFEVLPILTDWTMGGVSQLTVAQNELLLGEDFVNLNPDLGKTPPALDDASKENLISLRDKALGYVMANPKLMDQAAKLLQ